MLFTIVMDVLSESMKGRSSIGLLYTDDIVLC